MSGMAVVHFFDNLGDDLIADEVSLQMALVEDVDLQKKQLSSTLYGISERKTAPEGPFFVEGCWLRILEQAVQFGIDLGDDLAQLLRVLLKIHVVHIDHQAPCLWCR